jgi:hypothetical protein
MDSKQIVGEYLSLFDSEDFFECSVLGKNRRCVESIKKYNTNDNRIKDVYSELSEN